MKIISPSFKNNEPLDIAFAYFDCGGKNLSPELRWSEVPERTKSFVLICDDPNGPKANEPFVHWLVYDIPGTTTKLAQGESFQSISAHQGMTDFRQSHYNGPYPPKGSGMHHYHFKLYALDIEQLAVNNNSEKATIIKAMQGHVLAQAEIIGLFEIK